MWSIHLWIFVAEVEEKSAKVVGDNVGADIPNDEEKMKDLRVAEYGYDFGRLGFGFGRPIMFLLIWPKTIFELVASNYAKPHVTFEISKKEENIVLWFRLAKVKRKHNFPWLDGGRPAVFSHTLIVNFCYKKDAIEEKKSIDNCFTFSSFPFNQLI